MTQYMGDCRTILDELPPESVDCVITDPPYNIGKDFGEGTKADRKENYIPWLNDIWIKCGRIVRAGGFLIYTNRIKFIPDGMNPPEPWRFFHLFVWHKPLSLAGCWYGIAPHWEPIFVYLKGDKPWRPFRDSLVQSDVILANVVTDGNGSHPTVKPTTLIGKLIEWAVPVPGLVLDPFSGSGTTGVAAKSLGRQAILIDISEDYGLLARARVEKVNLPL